MWYAKTSGLTPEFVRIAHLHNSVFSKFVETDSGTDDALKGAAMTKFMHAEERCLSINLHGRYWSELTDRKLEGLISRSRALIAHVLGTVDLGGIFKHRMPTGGGTTSRTRQESHPYRKLLPNSRKPHVTPAALPYAYAYVKSATSLHTHFTERWRDGWFQLRHTSALAFVPKNNREHRIICKEPDMNIILQRCVGEYIRKRLTRVGVDLTDQTRNQVLARIGSISGLLATVDLSAASDSIALGLVKDLVPGDWYKVFADLRCEAVRLENGMVHPLQKISSMGNGFTFELESLIFWAFTVSSCESVGLKDPLIAIYGDDIVVPVEAVEVLHDLLTYTGFLFNNDKSFVDGHFRESCGKHYYRGVDVTPYYVKGLTGPQDVFLWFNNHLDWNGGVLDNFAKKLVHSLPFRSRAFVPLNYEGKKAGFRTQYGVEPCRYRVRGQRIFGRFRVFEPKKHDITERFSEASRYYAWFLTRIPPVRTSVDLQRNHNRTQGYPIGQMHVDVCDTGVGLTREGVLEYRWKWIEVSRWGEPVAV